MVVAEHQTAGRGRLDRTWETPARSALTFSVLLRPTAPAASWPWLPLLTGYAVEQGAAGGGVRRVGEVAERRTARTSRKVAGILVERVETDGGPAAVVGIGLNVGMTADELPVAEATSLAVDAGDGPRPDRRCSVSLLDDAVGGLRRVAGGRRGGRHRGSPRRTPRPASTIGRQVRVDLPSGEVLTGTATGIDPSGRLLVERTATAVSAGDVVHVRTE